EDRPRSPTSSHPATQPPSAARCAGSEGRARSPTSSRSASSARLSGGPRGASLAEETSTSVSRRTAVTATAGRARSEAPRAPASGVRDPRAGSIPYFVALRKLRATQRGPKGSALAEETGRRRTLRPLSEQRL